MKLSRSPPIRMVGVVVVDLGVLRISTVLTSVVAGDVNRAGKSERNLVS